jgi:Cd2+/Zn2+-exporting ATPase
MVKYHSVLIYIQTNQPSKVVKAIQIGHSTRKIVWQNIVLAFGVKVIVLILRAGGWQLCGKRFLQM